jgi:hypothetical protein
MGAVLYTWSATALRDSTTPHYDDTAVTIGSCVFLALLAAVVLIARGGRRRR